MALFQIGLWISLQITGIHRCHLTNPSLHPPPHAPAPLDQPMDNKPPSPPQLLLSSPPAERSTAPAWPPFALTLPVGGQPTAPWT
ncbi:unnamed protein product [Boreogadus saida]